MDARQDRFLPLAEVLSLTTLSRSTIWRLVSRGQFPQPTRLSSNRVGWRQAAVLAWMNQPPAAEIHAPNRRASRTHEPAGRSEQALPSTPAEALDPRHPNSRH